MSRLNYLFLLLFFNLFFPQTSNAQLGADKLYLKLTYNNSFWQTQSTSGNTAYINNPIRRRNSILGFRLRNGVTYSTGVDDAMLTANGITFTTAKFRSLPVTDIYFNDYNEPVPEPTYFSFPADADNSPNTAINNYFTFPEYKISIPLSMGTKGIDIGTAITNVPNTAELSFNLLNWVQTNGVTDDIPDLFITQEADPSSNNLDEIWFVDINGVMVGHKVTVQMSNNTTFPRIGLIFMDFFRLQSGTPAWQVNGSRNAKLFTVKLTDFGINATNFNSIYQLKYKFNGTSDPGVIAYNENTFRFVPLNAFNDTASTNRQTPVSINVLANDQYDSTQEGGANWRFEIVSQPPSGQGSAAVVGNQIVYTPTFSNISSPVTFTYTICDDLGCDTATVTVTIRNACTKSPNTLPADSNTAVGVSNLSQVSANWPNQIPNGYIALESVNQGMVITRTRSSNITNPVEGMVIYDTTDRCIKLYNGTTWNCIKVTCKE